MLHPVARMPVCPAPPWPGGGQRLPHRTPERLGARLRGCPFVRRGRVARRADHVPGHRHARLALGSGLLGVADLSNYPRPSACPLDAALPPSLRDQERSETFSKRLDPQADRDIAASLDRLEAATEDAMARVGSHGLGRAVKSMPSCAGHGIVDSPPLGRRSMKSTQPVQFDIDFQKTTPDVPFHELLDHIVDELDDVGREADYVASARLLTATFVLQVPDRTEGSLEHALSDLRASLGTLRKHGGTVAAIRATGASGPSGPSPAQPRRTTDALGR